MPKPFFSDLKISQIALFALLFFYTNAFSQHIDSLFNINYGKYDVGFRLIETFDNSRIYQFNKTSNSNKRPMQIGIWYPAKDAAGDKLALTNYLAIASRSESLIKDKSLEEIETKAFTNAYHINTERAKEVVQKELKSIINAEPVNDVFPLIIYAPGSSADFYENFLLFEYLASKGYVVLSSKSRGFRNPTMNALMSGVETQTRDMEFMMSKATELENTDLNNINVIGRSWGSIAALIFSIRNKEVTNSITSLDGTLSYNAIELLKDSPYPGGAFVYKPILLAVGKKRSKSATPIDRKNYYDNVLYADAHLVAYNEMRHTAFSSYYLLYHYLLNKDIDKKTANDLIKGYIDCLEHVGEFVDFYNKKDNNLNIQESDQYTYDYKEASEVLLPNYEDFGYALEVNGVDEAIEIYEQAHSINPEYANKELFNASYITLLPINTAIEMITIAQYD